MTSGTKAAWAMVVMAVGACLMVVGSYRQTTDDHSRDITAIQTEMEAQRKAAEDDHAQLEILKREEKSQLDTMNKLVDKAERIDRNVVVLCDRNHANCERE